MARYIGPKSKIARRFGEAIFGADKVLSRRNFPPGQHGNNRRRKQSEYAVMLAEKQKAKYTYGVLERQFRNMFAKAAKAEPAKLAEKIEDEPNNTTRFLVLGRQDAGISGRDKTSLVMSTPNRTGALHDLLAPLTAAGVSMCRLESRPARNALWEYVFYVDIEGHRETPEIKAALAQLAANAAYLKILGSYPAAVF